MSSPYVSMTWGLGYFIKLARGPVVFETFFVLKDLIEIISEFCDLKMLQIVTHGHLDGHL